ncbi:hypothetical protein [Haloglomus halophilum]|uniref:hypothetical protein n=1 Tax=Haloglomus halophilum TaxID=2962672 RepID=UPI0020C98CD0|nr:hypothetical protein [Haloglomus halophilum]
MTESSPLAVGLAIAVALLATATAAWALVVLCDRYVGRCPVPSLGRGVVMATGVQLVLIAIFPDIPVLLAIAVAAGFLPALETFWRCSLAGLQEGLRTWGVWVSVVAVVLALVTVPAAVVPTLSVAQFALVYLVFVACHVVLYGPLSARVGCWHEATHLAVLRLLGVDYSLSVDLRESRWLGYEILQQARWEVRYQDILSLGRPQYYALHLAPLAVAVPAAAVAGLLTSPLGPGVALGAYYGVLVHAGPSSSDLRAGLSPVMRGPSAESVAAAQRNHGLAEGVPA